MRLEALLALLSLLPAPILAVLADEAYTVDYHHELLGLPLPHTTFFYRPKREEKASLLYTLSDVGVLGAVNPASGAVVWRRLHAGHGNETFLRGVEGANAVVSGVGAVVAQWDALSGREKWHNAFEGEVRDIEVIEGVGTGQEAADVLALFVHQEGQGPKTTARKLDGENGDVVWEFEDVNADVPLGVSTDVKSVFAVGLKGSWGGYQVKVTSLDPVTGKRVDEVLLGGTLQGPEDVLFVGANSAAPIVAWVEKSTKAVKATVLGTKLVQSLRPSSAPSDEPIEKIIVHAPHVIQSQPHFLVHSQSATHHWAEVYHIDLAAGTISQAYHLPRLPGKGAFSTSSVDANVYFTRHTEDEIILVSSASHAVLGRWPLKDDSRNAGSAVHMVTDLVVKSATEFAIRSAVLTAEDDWTLIRQGASAWLRREGLTGAVAAAWAEFPEQQTLAQTLEQEAHSDPLTAYVHRVRRHISDLQYLPAYLEKLPARFLNSFLSEEVDQSREGALARDSFGFHKMVIVATSRGRLYALNAGDRGKVLWTAKVFNLAPGETWDVKGMLVDDVRGQVTIQGAAGEHVVIVAATGQVLELRDRGGLPAVQSTAIIDGDDGTYLLPIGPGGNPGPLAKNKAPKGVLVVRGEDGEVKGLTFGPKNERDHDNDGLYYPITAWTFKPAVGQRIVNLVSRPAHDPIASIGRVLGDRSVMYKYLNPNLILIITVSDVAATAHFYLVDSVSGDLIHSSTHEAVDTTQPIPALFSENWFVYSLWSDAAAASSTAPARPTGYQLVVADLFESPVANDRGILGSAANFSSLAPTSDADNALALPHVVSQAFVVPEAITHMAVTQTRQGISTRQLLCALADSHAIVGLPRNLVDPRRIVGRDPTPAEMEEGLFRYDAFLDFAPQAHLTHKRDVIGVKTVITAPTLLESTSLVFACGIDVFGTRVAPSLAFDVLGKGFGKLSLIATVLGLGAGVGVLAPMVRRKQIDARWKTS